MVAALLVAVAGIAALTAQPAPSVKRTVLMKQDSMVVSGREVVMADVEIPPGGSEGKHTHPAEVYGFVREGEISLFVEGQPDRTLKAGDVFAIAPGQVHMGTNKTKNPVKLLAVFFAEKGKPLTTPVQ
jgi:quercetin dioxygenase-like cupin family protein